jgi:hypothetical protein
VVGGGGAGGALGVERARDGVDGRLDERDEVGGDAGELNVGNADGGLDDAEVENSRRRAERGLDGVMPDFGRDALCGERGGEGVVERVDQGAVARSASSISARVSQTKFS